MLDANNHQGKFGQDYVRVLASAAGLIVTTPDLDFDGIDLGIEHPGRLGAAAAPAIDVQVKTWSNPRKSGGKLLFDSLDEVQFNQLAGPDYLVPRYLFLVIVPPVAGAYAEVGNEGMLLRRQGHFHSLHDQVPICDPSRKRRRRVHVPVGNVLTVESLRDLLRHRRPDTGGD